MKTVIIKGGESTPGFWDLENKCQTAFDEGGPFWHICTDGNSQEIIFTSVKDFIAAMNALAIVLHGSGVQLIAFILMNNHVHFIMEGKKEKCLEVFERFKKKLDRYLSREGRANVLSNFKCDDPIAIETLDQLRTEICYVHRNMYVVRNDILPHTWPWGSGMLYFNPAFVQTQTKSFNELTHQDRRLNYFYGRETEMPDNYVCANGYILPESFVSYKRGELFFRHASNYYYSLNKNHEAYSLVARRLGDSQVLNYEEIYSASVAISHDKWKNSKPATLPQDAKMELAKALHFDYKVGNYDISRVLKLDQSILAELFPERS